MMSLLSEVIEKVIFFLAESSFRISAHPFLTIASAPAAVDLTFPIRLTNYADWSLIEASYILVCSAT